MPALSRRTLVLLAAVTTAGASMTALSACSGATSASDATSAAPATDSGSTTAPAVTEPDVVLDVRTPEEFAQGHVDGAVNIDFSAQDFDDRIAELDPSASYAVYCRSGNRSAQALQRMTAAGFTDVQDLGSLSEAADALGREVVTQ